MHFSPDLYSAAGLDSGGAIPEFGDTEKGAKSDFCLFEFRYDTEHLWIWKAIYGADIMNLEKLDVSFFLCV